ncbi:MAG: DUF4019 domain-containing protein [Sphingomonas sp.]|uniref:hypothetical protein n=1 Tax=Sphingomonas sp. TaxID=28214 RepID=UPI0011F996E0|nr:hypothetical protein [Sphingomonas sp.]THD35268.1 MAG: DUF4019 domain-containing protein [Sphingomonas sp.]
MKRLSIAIAAGLVLGGCSMGADVKAGGDAVAAFHKQLDAGQSAAIEAAAGPEMKTTPGQFIQLLDAVHRKLGASGASQQVGFNDAVNPGGHFLTLNYQTTFAKGPATETFVYRIDGGKAVLAGYNINSQALILN